MLGVKVHANDWGRIPSDRLRLTGIDSMIPSLLLHLLRPRTEVWVTLSRRRGNDCRGSINWPLAVTETTERKRTK